MLVELSLEELKDLQTAVICQEKVLPSDEALFKKLGLAITHLTQRAVDRLTESGDEHLSEYNQIREQAGLPKLGGN